MIQTISGLLVSLLDRNGGDAAVHAVGGNPMILRRTKKRCARPTGKTLPERIVETLDFSLFTRKGVAGAGALSS